MPDTISNLPSNLSESLGTIALAIGALGAASYGIVDGLKLISWIDLSGFERLFSQRIFPRSGTAGGRIWPTKHKAGLDPLFPALKVAYGADVMAVLRTQYRNGRAKGDLPRTLRQGIRIGFSMMTRDEIMRTTLGLGIAEETTRLVADALEHARKLRPPATGEMRAVTPVPAMGDEERAALARLETTIDARIDAALLLADNQYVTQAKVWATLVALAIAFGVGLELQREWYECFLVGITAVPLAPVAKDLATALQEAVKAFRRR
ncbi:MAG: hypothetical protein HY273_12950 [Gammaproteobacteria bacterium]|nr:hypothetical protein [Gammaproteobacteria bacterium]